MATSLNPIASAAAVNQCVAEQHAFGFVHAEMHGQNLLDTPIRHRIAHKHRAGCDVVSLLSLAHHGLLHLSDRDPPRRFNAACHQTSRRLSLQAFSSVIRLLRPLFINKLDPPPVNGDRVRVTLADDDKRRPPRMSFHPECDFHEVSLLVPKWYARSGAADL
jgi:hypothetical protein